MEVFDHLVADSRFGVNLTGSGDPERLRIAYVSEGYFKLFGVAPLVGRTFATGEHVPGAHRVVILSHGLWQRRFGGEPSVVSRAIRFDGVEYSVIGVMPPGFDYPAERELWAPLALEPERRQARAMHFLFVQGRLSEGRTLDEARVEMASLASRLEQQYPDVNTGHGVRVELLKDELLGAVEDALLLLFVVSLFVLLICCANVANLWLARSAARERELAVAAALGASRSRLLRPLVLESLVAALIAGSLGSLAALLVSEPLVQSVLPGRSVSPKIEVLLVAGLASGAALVLAGLTSLLCGRAISRFAWLSARASRMSCL